MHVRTEWAIWNSQTGQTVIVYASQPCDLNPATGLPDMNLGDPNMEWRTRTITTSDWEPIQIQPMLQDIET